MKPKNEIPWRRRRDDVRSKNQHPSEKESWKNKAVTRAQAIGAALVTSLAWFLLNGVTALQNAEQLPDAYTKTRDSILSRYYDDSSWTGVWSSNPEGYVDSEDVQLSDVDVYLELHTGQGNVDGTIATHKLCTRLPFATNGILFKGKVSGNGVQGIAYDYIGGKEVQLASIKIHRDSNDSSILLVNVGNDALESLPLKARIRRDFNREPFNMKSTDSPYCEPVRYPNGHIRSQKRKPIAELQRTPPSAQ